MCDVGPASLSPCIPPEVQVSLLICQDGFSAVSYGDPFFEACLTLTLLPCTPQEVQVSQSI